MIEILDRLTSNGALTTPALIRSLLLWRQILGDSTDASDRLRRLTAPLIQLPATAEVTPFVIPIRANPDGFDVQEGLLPGADAVFAYVAEEGLQLSCSIDPGPDGRTVRRLQVLGADGVARRRRGAERFMLRYRLPPEALQARELMFVAITLGQEGTPEPLPRLQVWVELDQGEARRFVMANENIVQSLDAVESLQLFSFAPGALAAAGSPTATGFMALELTAEVLDVRLLGEALLVGN